VIIEDQSPVICTVKLPNWPSNEPKSRLLD
jgi:hypothetical protein